MYERKHSAGCWIVGPRKSAGRIWVQTGKGGQVVATVEGWAEAKANARLIAAAPELLEACRLICMTGSAEPEYALSLCRAAFEKATGLPPSL